MLAASDPHRLDGVTAIGVDEHVWRHTPLGDRYVTVIVDITDHTRGRTARLLDVIPGRSAHVVGKWIRRQGPAFRSRVRVVTMDAFEGFKKAAQSNLPYATEIVDPFHVVHLAALHMDRVRCRLQIEQTGRRGRRGDPLYSSRRALHKSDEFKTLRQQEKVQSLFQNPENRPLLFANGVYQKIISSYRQPNKQMGQHMMGNLIDALNVSGALREIPELRPLARTLRRREHDILAYFTYQQSNGPIEAINGRLESLRRIALGFRNIINYRLRCLIHSGTLKDTLLHP